jgi:hypothetical protein
MSMLRKLLRFACLACAGLILATLVMEAGFRLVAATPLWRVLPVPEVALYGPDPDAGYGHRPGAQGIWLTENRTRVTISSLGLRDRERSLERGLAPRAVVVGNSVIEALQVDQSQTAAAVAEQALQHRWPGAEVVNMGLAGATPAVEIARLVSRGPSLKPDVAIVFLPLGDLVAPGMQDDSAYPAYRTGSDGVTRLSHSFRETRGYRFRTSTAGQIFYWALDHSMVVALLNNRKNIGLFAEFRAAGRAPEQGRQNSRCDPAALEKHGVLWLTDRHPNRGMRDAVLRDLEEISKRYGMKIVVAAGGIPAGCPDPGGTRSSVMDAIARRFGGAGIAVVDLDAELVRRVGAGSIGELYGFGLSIGGGHLNVRGNRIYGEIMAVEIEGALDARTRP